MDTSEVVGTVGAVTLVGAYFAMTKGKISSTGRMYHSLNVCGAAMVGANALVKEAWPAFGLEAAWAAIGVYGLIRGERPPAAPRG